jgi:hypothetical protein
MNLTDVGKKNLIKRCDQNLIIPWDDPYPHISETLSENQQLTLKNLNLLEAKKGILFFFAPKLSLICMN